MKHFALLAILALPLQLAAQSPEPLQMGRPTFATSGREMMPQMLIDEATITVDRFAQQAYPPALWAQEKSCLAGLGIDVRKAGAPPTVIVIPAVRTIRVRQITLDSMWYAQDSTFAGEHWDPPTIAEAVIHSNFIVVTAPFRLNPYVLRHEALHFLLWRLKLAPLGHPVEFFGPCDAYFDPPTAVAGG